MFLIHMVSQRYRFILIFWKLAENLTASCYQERISECYRPGTLTEEAEPFRRATASAFPYREAGVWCTSPVVQAKQEDTLWDLPDSETGRIYGSIIKSSACQRSTNAELIEHVQGVPSELSEITLRRLHRGLRKHNVKVMSQKTTTTEMRYSSNDPCRTPAYHLFILKYFMFRMW